MIIALTGYKQSGKSTAANHLVEMWGFTKINFKDALIDEIKQNFPDFIKAECQLYNCDPAYLFEKKPGHIRQLMQNYGTELRRKEWKNYWTDEWEQRSFGTDKVVVDDCRFLNEAESVRRCGGKIVRIIRKGQFNPDTHQSETEMAEIIPDYTIEVGDGEQLAMYQQLDIIVIGQQKHEKV